MRRLFQRVKIALGKENPAWQAAARDFSLYSHLPLAQPPPKKFGPEAFMVLLFCTALLYLFVFVLVSLVKVPSPSGIRLDYITAVVTAAVLSLASIFVIFFYTRHQVKQMKAWKLYRNAWVESQGSVLGKWWEQNSEFLEFYIAIQYEANMKVKVLASSNLFDRVKAGDRIRIKYVRHKPIVLEMLTSTGKREI